MSCVWVLTLLQQLYFLSYWQSNAYPKILCVPEKEERKRENGNIARRISSLSRAWWRNQEMLQRLDRPIYQRPVNTFSPKDSPSKTSKAGSFEGCRPWIETKQHVYVCGEFYLVINFDLYGWLYQAVLLIYSFIYSECQSSERIFIYTRTATEWIILTPCKGIESYWGPKIHRW